MHQPIFYEPPPSPWPFRRTPEQLGPEGASVLIDLMRLACVEMNDAIEALARWDYPVLLSCCKRAGFLNQSITLLGGGILLPREEKP